MKTKDYIRGYNSGYKQSKRGGTDRLNEFLSPNVMLLEWIPITMRPLHKDEIEYYKDRDLMPEFIYTCELPEDGEEVLITTMSGYVTETTFFNDGDGSYFESYEDWDDVKAWMRKPKPYKGGEQNDY